jgi:phage tail tape-measure protein
MTNRDGSSSASELYPPPGVDGAAVRAWAEEFAMNAPPMRRETANMIVGLMRAGMRRAAEATAAQMRDAA